MFVRLAICAAALSLTASGAEACACRVAHVRPVVHIVRHKIGCGCHLYRHAALRYGRRVRIEEPVLYERSEAVSESRSDHYSESDGDQGYSYHYGYGWDEPHLSATDRYGYLTWPGKYALDGQDEGCAADCEPQDGAEPAYPGMGRWRSENGYVGDRYGAGRDPGYRAPYAGRAYSGQAYSGQGYADQRYPEQGYSRQVYGAQRYPDQAYSGQGAAPQHYQSQGYAGRSYPAPRYPNQPVPAQGYYNQGDSDQAYADPRNAR